MTEENTSETEKPTDWHHEHQKLENTITDATGVFYSMRFTLDAMAGEMPKELWPHYESLRVLESAMERVLIRKEEI